MWGGRKPETGRLSPVGEHTFPLIAVGPFGLFHRPAKSADIPPLYRAEPRTPLAVVLSVLRIGVGRQVRPPVREVCPFSVTSVRPAIMGQVATFLFSPSGEGRLFHQRRLPLKEASRVFYVPVLFAGKPSFTCQPSVSVSVAFSVLLSMLPCPFRLFA